MLGKINRYLTDFGIGKDNLKMPRPMLLAFLLLILILTSQFEWKQPILTEADYNPTTTPKQSRISRQEVAKEKIILSQEKQIRKLNGLIESLKQQLRQCRSNTMRNNTVISLTEYVIEVESRKILED